MSKKRPWGMKKTRKWKASNNVKSERLEVKSSIPDDNPSVIPAKAGIQEDKTKLDRPIKSDDDKKKPGNNGSSYFPCRGKGDQITEDVCLVRQHRNPLQCRGCGKRGAA
jgi:hypothetical protein